MQNVLRRMAAAQGMHAGPGEGMALDRMAIAARTLESGRHQQALQAAIASIVRSSSRYSRCLHLPCMTALNAKGERDAKVHRPNIVKNKTQRCCLACAAIGLGALIGSWRSQQWPYQMSRCSD